MLRGIPAVSFGKTSNVFTELYVVILLKALVRVEYWGFYGSWDTFSLGTRTPVRLPIMEGFLWSSWCLTEVVNWFSAPIVMGKQTATGFNMLKASLAYLPPHILSQVSKLAHQSIPYCNPAVRFRRSPELLWSAETNQHTPDCYQNSSCIAGQKLQPDSRNIQHTESKKPFPHFIGPFLIKRIISPSAVRLNLLPSMRAHPVFDQL